MTEARPDAIVVAKANCGIPEFHDGHIHYSGTPALMADYARLAADAGARIVGGCCGTSAEHLAAMRKALDEHTAAPRPALADIVARVGPLTSPPADNTNREPRRSSRRRA
jgi:5-methyltetrahydrofolate--homocysteine methyltransferase